MLDIKMWIEELNGIYKILYEHYEKKMATKMIIHAKSAVPMQMKRTVLTQEMLRILLHCSTDLPWTTVQQHMSNFTLKMQYSGYKQTFRYDVTKSAINAYCTMRENEKNGIRPLYRRKTWNKAERI